MEDFEPEFQSVETFVQFLIDDERESFTHVELSALAARVRKSHQALKKELESWGLTLEVRQKERKTRGINSKDHDRWEACPTFSGSGWNQISGFAGQAANPWK